MYDFAVKLDGRTFECRVKTGRTQMTKAAACCVVASEVQDPQRYVYPKCWLT